MRHSAMATAPAQRSGDGALRAECGMGGWCVLARSFRHVRIASPPVPARHHAALKVGDVHAALQAFARGTP